MKRYLKSSLFVLTISVMSSAALAETELVPPPTEPIACQAMIRPASRSQADTDRDGVNTYKLTEVVEIDGIVVPVYSRANCVASEVLDTPTAND